ncbi:MAG TPA: serine hydrolase domain-containing protein [Bryobacteraceae bacterium]|nr:serine hydrolase domain-containing protein [Bryobacteraceae bacterium]
MLRRAFLATGAAAAARLKAGGTDRIARARSVVQAVVDTHGVPGLSVAVGRHGNLQWSEGFGLANVEQKIPATPLTGYRVGSVSKVLTTAAVARLVDAGRLDLDAPVQRYVPSFPVKQWPVTTRQLAGHIAGIRHYVPEDFSGPLKGAPHFARVEEGLAIFSADPLQFEPGTKYSYSSYGWNLVSAVVEGASGRPFLDYMQSEVFDVLGLRRTAADQVRNIIPFRSAFYERDEQGTLLHAPYCDNSYKWAGGGFLSSAEDLVRFGSAHLQAGFLRQNTLDLLFTSQKLSSGTETGVGIGWRVGRDETGRRVVHHSGSLEGGRAVLMMFPESGVVVALAANLFARFGEKDAIAVGQLFIG